MSQILQKFFQICSLIFATQLHINYALDFGEINVQISHLRANKMHLFSKIVFIY